MVFDLCVCVYASEFGGGGGGNIYGTFSRTRSHELIRSRHLLHNISV